MFSHSAPRTEAQKLSGVFVIMQTPFLDTLAIDEESMIRQVDFLLRCQVHGMVWPSGASEVGSLSYRERLRFTDVLAGRVQGRIPLVIGVSAPNKFEAAEYAQHAASAGATAILTLPQMDMNPTDPAMLDEYLSHICGCCDLPLIVQTAYPGMPPSVSPGFLMNLAKRHPQIQYVKEEQIGMGPLPWRISEYVKKSAGSLMPMAGAGARNLLNELRRGSVGTMPGAGFADVQVCIWDLFQRGSLLQAREVFAKMLMMAVLEQTTGYVLQKEILRRRGIFKTTLMRSTRRVLMDEDDMKELDDICLALQPYCIS